jgi:predicted molibdopterin-dependent oxidoreductase YjgC
MEEAVKPPGDAKPDWWWCRQVATAMGFTNGLHDSAANIFDEFARSTAGRPNDQSGLTHDVLRRRGPQQWPYPALGQNEPHKRRYTDGHFPTPSGRARFFARPYTAREESPNGRFPLLLTTGRVAGQWHTRTKTGCVEKLNQMDPSPYLQMNPADAAALHLHDKQRVEVASRQGRAWSILRIDEKIAVGTVFMPMHWSDLWSEASSPNEAITDACDPISKEPALKYVAVHVQAWSGEMAPSDAESASRTIALPVRQLA